MLCANSGLRECELLAVHTSRVKLDELAITVDRQLDRYTAWTGSQPPLNPPKGFKTRTAVVFPSYAETLERRCLYADAHTCGWLFAPSRKQRWWAEAFISMCERGGEFLDAEYRLACDDPDLNETLAVRWQHTFHEFRHLYASLALTPHAAGGLGWSVPFVQDSLGHASERTLRDYYQHITREEHRAAITTPFVWPAAS